LDLLNANSKAFLDWSPQALSSLIEPKPELAKYLFKAY